MKVQTTTTGTVVYIYDTGCLVGIVGDIDRQTAIDKAYQWALQLQPGITQDSPVNWEDMFDLRNRFRTTTRPITIRATVATSFEMDIYGAVKCRPEPYLAV